MTVRRAFFLFFVACMAVVTSLLACSGTQGQTDGGNDGSTDGTVGEGGSKPDGKNDVTDAGAPDCHNGAGGPRLTALSVTSTTDTKLTLIPQFSPSIHDYYVRCAAGTSTLELSMTASSCAETQLTQPTPASPLMLKQSLSVMASEGQALVAVASEGKTSTEYWIRCLPHDFPQLAFDLHPEAGTPPQGYYLLGSFKVEPGESGYAMVLDSHGVPVWYFKETVAGIGIINVDTQQKGDISFIPSPSPKPYEIHELEPWRTSHVGTPGHDDEHELQRLENGHYFIFTQPVVSGVDMTGFKVEFRDGGSKSFGPNSDIHGCKIEEHNGNDAVVWSWDILSHLDPVKDCMYPQISLTAGPDGGPVLDPFHCNSIDIDPKNGNLLVSARHTDSVFYVDKNSKAILWKMGGSPYTVEGAPYVSVAADAFHRQHDARLHDWVATCNGGSGQVSMFDDETATAATARAVLYSVHVASGDGGVTGDCGALADAGATSATVAWEYAQPAKRSSVILGSFRILPDGSHVIGWGVWQVTASIPGNVTFSEVDVNGHDLLDFALDRGTGNTSYRAIKVPLSAFDLEVLRTTAGHAPP